MSSVRHRSVPKERVLIVHNHYQQAGGEDVVVANEMRLLAERGHAVELHSASNHDIAGLLSKARTFRDLTYSRTARDELAARIAAFAPDVVHVHNFFPLLTTSIYDACRSYGVPVVQTLHNYRITCAAAILMRDGKTCEKCIGGSPLWGVVHRCYRGSLPGSIALARMIAFNRRRGTWREKVDRFIAPSQAAKALHMRAGVPAHLIAVKPNFTADPGEPTHGARSGAVFVGRLSEEKGVRTLIDAWRGIDVPLRAIGDGPLSAALEEKAAAGVTFLGRLTPAGVADEMRRAAFLVMPSTNFEGFPMVLAEAFAHGLPCVVSDLGAMREVVEEGVTGLRFAPGDPAALAEAVRQICSDPERLSRMGRAARKRFLDRYAPDANYTQLIEIYRACLRSENKVTMAATLRHAPAEQA